MKRAIITLLFGAMMLSFTACGSALDTTLEVLDELDSIAQLSESEEISEYDFVSEAEEPVVQEEESIQAEEPAEEWQLVEEEGAPVTSSSVLPEDGSYTQKDDVALYIYTYAHLPDNFITKKEAQALGWSGGGLDKYAPGMCIGGDRFGNYEEKLPKKKGRSYTECDIDTLGAKGRGAKRIVFSNDGLIYYTEDHYETFELLYGEP